MRFMDASVFLYAYLKPKKELPERILSMKKQAKEIIMRISKGEKVVTTLVHLSEIANIVESKINNRVAAKVVMDILNTPTISVLDVKKEDYIEAARIAREVNVGVNDALSYVIMKRKNIREIYSFDSDFDKFEDIERLTR